MKFLYLATFLVSGLAMTCQAIKIGRRRPQAVRGSKNVVDDNDGTHLRPSTRNLKRKKPKAKKNAKKFGRPKNAKKPRKPDIPDGDDPDGCPNPLKFFADWTITNDYYELLRAEAYGMRPDFDTDFILQIGPFTQDRINWTYENEEVCLDSDACYYLRANDRHEGAPFGYPPSDIIFDGETMFCTGDGPRGDHNTCYFGNCGVIESCTMMQFFAPSIKAGDEVKVVQEFANPVRYSDEYVFGPYNEDITSWESELVCLPNDCYLLQVNPTSTVGPYPVTEVAFGDERLPCTGGDVGSCYFGSSGCTNNIFN